MHRFLILSLLYAFSPATGQGFDYDAYRPAVLADVATGMPRHPAEWIAEGSSRIRTRVVFAGHIRNLSTHRKRFIAKWFATMGYPVGEAAVFEQEIEVTQGGLAYRMPIQAVLVDQLKSEVPAGASFEVYLLLMGSERGQLVFTISEFDATTDVHAPAETDPPPTPAGEGTRK